MSDDLTQMFEKPGAVFDNALSSLTKKTASTVWGKFKTQLSTASAPFLRKGMGERYLNSGNLFGGCLMWALGTVAALYIPSLRSAAGIICQIMSWSDPAHLFQLWFFPLVIGLAMIFFNYIYGLESITLMARYRADGVAYHSMSRGIPRWGEDTGKVSLGIAITLLLFDLPAGILFLVSCGMSAKLAAEQQAAIYARYLDALDQKIEQEYLEDAMIGNCPTEITQLTKPLPANMNPDLRNNIAASAVGKPAKIVAKAPKPKTQAPA